MQRHRDVWLQIVLGSEPPAKQVECENVEHINVINSFNFNKNH